MARVVQRRSNPTVVYVLVAFVILFLISTVVATLQYMEADDLRNQLVEQQETLDRLASSTDLNKTRIASMMKESDQTVIDTLTDRLDSLAGWVDADAETFLAARQAWTDLREQDLQITQENPDAPTASEGLIPLVRTLRQRVQSANEAEQRTAIQLQNIQQELSEKEQTIEQLKQSHASAITELRGESNKQSEMLKNRETAHEEALAKAREESKAIQKDLRARIEELGTQIDDLQITINLKNQRIKELETTLAGGRPEGPEGDPKPKTKPDGKIVRVIDADDVCYINIGSRDGVKAGMPFTVYGDETIPTDGEGKARIVVRNTDRFSSECQVISQEEGKPVLRGDVIGNVAFNPLRAPTFVVRGDFDLFGEDKATPQNRRIVKNLIKRFGGKVSDELSVQTDFLVLGEEPARPSKPDEGAQDQGEYQRQLKEYLRYQNIKDEARRLGVPVLNTSRFLAYTGYKPQKTRKY